MEIKNIYISCDSGKYKNKLNTEEITKSLKKLCNKFTNFDKFNEEYNKFIDNIVKLNIINLKKSQVLFLQTKEK